MMNIFNTEMWILSGPESECVGCMDLAFPDPLVSIRTLFEEAVRRTGIKLSADFSNIVARKRLHLLDSYAYFSSDSQVGPGPISVFISKNGADVDVNALPTVAELGSSKSQIQDTQLSSVESAAPVEYPALRSDTEDSLGPDFGEIVLPQESKNDSSDQSRKSQTPSKSRAEILPASLRSASWEQLLYTCQNPRLLQFLKFGGPKNATGDVVNQLFDIMFLWLCTHGRTYYPTFATAKNFYLHLCEPYVKKTPNLISEVFLWRLRRKVNRHAKVS